MAIRFEITKLKELEDYFVKVAEKNIKEIARKYNIRILGPNSMGAIIPGKKLNASTMHLPVTQGKIAFISSYAAFSPGRNNEQIRTTISLNNVPVKIVGSHAGVSVGPDGATHQALEDIALMRVQPNMTVLVPADSEEARKATIASASTNTPVYIRLARAGSPVFTTKDTPFEIGKAEVLFESDSPEVAIIATGNLVHNALLAANDLEQEGLGVIVVNNHTIKPIDKNTIIDVAKKAGAVVTVEEHQVAGGAGSAVAEVLAQEYPVPIEFIGVQDQFGQSGEPKELIEHYGMGIESIKKAVKRVVERK